MPRNVERMNSEMLHMLGYLHVNQWADAIVHAQEIGLLPFELYAMIKEVDAHYDMHMIDAIKVIVKEKEVKK